MWPLGRSQYQQIRDLLETFMATTQEQLDALTDAINQGVAELRDEIQRLSSVPPEDVDFTRLQAIADALAGDNIPAAPEA